MVLVVAGGASSYFLYLVTGQSPLAKLKFPAFSRVDADFINPLKNKSEQAYKWVDEKGITHYSTEAPVKEQAVEVLEVNTETNIIQGVELRQQEEQTDINALEGPVYNPENIKKLVDNAKNVEKVLQERHEKQEQIINNM